MDFFGPDIADFANVRALNHAWLVRLRNPRQGAALRRTLSPAIRTRVEELTDLQLERLAATPFLLFSVCERDDARWRGIRERQPTPDLLANASDGGDELRTTAIAFLWQLAARNPYAARVVTGAGIELCERLAAGTLPDVLQAAARIDGLLHPRFAAEEDFWHKLLGPGIASNERVRRSAHITCLQWLLTGDPLAGYRRLRAAACANPVPALSVADRTRRR